MESPPVVKLTTVIKRAIVVIHEAAQALCQSSHANCIVQNEVFASEIHMPLPVIPPEAVLLPPANPVRVLHTVGASVQVTFSAPHAANPFSMYTCHKLTSKVTT